METPRRPYPFATPWAGGGGDAHAWDSPGANAWDYWLLEPFSQDFETTAVCRAGKEAGTSYGTLDWDHAYWNNSVHRTLWNTMTGGSRKDAKISITVRIVPIF